MPKLYEYFGIVVFFYSNEHEPVHVHGRHAGRESRADIIIENGRIVRIEYGDVAGKLPLEGRRLRDFQTLVETKADDIVQKWIDFFVRNLRVTPESITRKLT